MMVVGVDSHKDSLVCAVVDQAGRGAGSGSFPNTAPGHEAMAAWVRQLGSVRRVGIEGSGSYGRGLAQLLVSAGWVVVDVPPQMTSGHGAGNGPERKPILGTRWLSLVSRSAMTVCPRSKPLASQTIYER